MYVMSDNEIVKLKIRWNYWLIFLSFVVGMIGSYTTTYMLYMLDRSRSRKQRITWLLMSCLTFGGVTVWALHFTGMMALDVHYNVSYGPFITFLSFLVATFGSVLAFSMKYKNIFAVVIEPDVESLEQVPLLETNIGDDTVGRQLRDSFFPKTKIIVIASFFQACAIFAMHYVGMYGMKIDNVQMKLNYWWMALSFIPAWILSVPALNLMPRTLEAKKQLTFSVFNTSAVFLLHYVGIYAASFYTTNKNPPPICPKNNIPFFVITVVSVSCFTAFTVAAQEISKQRDVLMETVRTKQYIAQLENEKERLERETKDKSEFMAIASHEMRTPLHAISGFCELLAGTNLDDDQKYNLSMARKSIDVLQNVVDNVLNYSRLLNNTLIVEQDWCDLSNVIVSIMEAQLYELVQPVTVLFIESSIEKHMVYCDKKLLSIIIQNLVSNAYKFTDKGLVLVKLSTTNHSCTISVQDTGIGIAKDKIPSIFSPYAQLDKTLSRQFTGTGLGLAICNMMAKLLQGTILVTSDLGTGSTFDLTFPAKIQDVSVRYPTKIPLLLKMTSNMNLPKSRSQLYESVVVEEMQKFTTSAAGPTLYWNQNTTGSISVTLQSFNKKYNVVDFHTIYQDIWFATKGQLIEHVEITPALDHQLDLYDEDNSQKHILVAEDNKVNQKLIEKQLKKLGYKYDLVENGQLCVEQMEKKERPNYCCILMDCQMPTMDGFQASKEILNKYPDTKIIALTANVSDLSRAQSEAVGMRAFLAKPLKLQELQTTLKKYC